MTEGDQLLIVLEQPERWFVFTLRDLEQAFDNVLRSRSYRGSGVYVYSSLPKKSLSYEVPLGSISLPASVADEPAPRPARRKQHRRALPDVPANLSVYEWANHAADHAGVERESPSYFAAVDSWRAIWRPEKVRVLLVAESHVAERPGDNDVVVRHEVATLPYCRLIYCPGYGENSLCSPTPVQNRGTPQFWRIFRAVSCQGNGPVPKGPDRLRWKVQTLDLLRRRGIWLVDACVTALAAPRGRRRFPSGLEKALIRESWQRFVWPTVAGDRPEQIWIIGKGVGRALRGRDEVREDRVISQPQDWNRARYEEGLARMVEAICGE